MNLNFRAFGHNGEPLLILHGMLGSLNNWLPVSRQLSSHFRVFALDQRNHGASPHSDEMDYRVLAEDVIEFMQQRGLERCHVMGHSMGGKAAMEAALRHPTNILKLIIVDIAPRSYPAQHRDILDAMLGVKLQDFRTRKGVEHALATRIPDVDVRRFLVQNVGRQADGRLVWKLNLQAIASHYDRLVAGLPDNRSFEGPALFLRGELSDYIQPEDEPLIRRFFPSARFRSVPGAGHWVHTERPELFLNEVLQFLLPAG